MCVGCFSIYHVLRYRFRRLPRPCVWVFKFNFIVFFLLAVFGSSLCAWNSEKRSVFFVQANKESNVSITLLPEILNTSFIPQKASKLKFCVPFECLRSPIKNRLFVTNSDHFGIYDYAIQFSQTISITFFCCCCVFVLYSLRAAIEAIDRAVFVCVLYARAL